MKQGSRTKRGLTVVVAFTCLAVVTACTPTVRMGGPANLVGNDPTVGGAQPNFWAAINGPYTTHATGDPYDTKCAGNPTTATSCGAPNPLYTPNGELFAVDVPPAAVNSPVSVEIYDPALGPNPALGETVIIAPFTTSYELFSNSGIPGTYLTDAAHEMAGLGACDAATPGTAVFAAGANASSFTDAWYTLCTFTPTQAGVYPLRVKSSDIPGVTDQGGGFNAFSVKAVSTAASQPTVYPLVTSSVWLNSPPNDFSMYLGRFDSFSAGKTLVVDLFDPGDSQNGPTSIQVLAPPSGAPALVPTGGTPVSCSYNAIGSVTPGPATPDTSPLCTVVTQLANAVGIYNDRWLRLSIPIPADYSCTDDCWWTLAYHFGSAGPTDRVTWRVFTHH